MLNRDRVTPGNVVRRNAQAGGQALALRRAGGVVAAYDGLNQLRIQSRRCDELANANSALFHVECYWLHYDRNLITLLTAGAHPGEFSGVLNCL